MPMSVIAVCMAVAAPTELVVCMKTPIIGRIYGGFKASSTLPMQKRITRRKTKAMNPFMAID